MLHSLARKCLQLFLAAWPVEYSLNTHILHHLARCVSLHGPLWTFWAFPYETALGDLTVHAHGRHAVEHQIAFAANMIGCFPMLLSLAASDVGELSERDQRVPNS